MVEFVTAIGLVFVLEGIFYAIAPHRLKSMMAMAEKMPEDSLRTMGLIAVATGVLIVWVSKSYM